ncbi:oligosaccharide flippase family protein [Micromonospora sp. WMMD723]|uniref:oligosaccharide flippase family protein n=1 Tax=Micromonospora sp. WMMD723 TaxID=3403465 RepID=UPI003CF4D808
MAHASAQGDRHVRGMARGGGLNLLGALLSQAAVFLIMLLLARVLGIREVGRYAQCYAVLSLAGLLSLSGFRAGLTRFVAVHLADDDAPALRGTVRLGLAVSAGSSVLLAGALVWGAPWLADRLHDPGLVTGLRLVALTLPASTVCEAALAATRGWRTQRPYTFIGQLYEPGTRLLLTALALLTGAGLTGAFWALVVAGWSAALLALLALARLVRRVPPARPVHRPGELFRFSTVSWVSSLSSTGLIWVDTLLLGFFANPDIGVYNVATRLVTVAIFVLAPVNAAFGPYLAHLHHRGDLDDVRRVYAVATGWVVRLSLPAFVALLVLPGDLLRVFGGEVATGAAVTVVLALGQLVNAATGPCGTVLNMSGRVALNMADNLVALVLNVLLNLWLIPAYGIVGAAAAWSASLIVVNIARVVQVRHLTGALPFTVGMAKGLAAGAAALAAGLLVRWLVPGWPWRPVAGLTAIVAVYLGTVLALGLSREDLMVLRTLARRRRRGDPSDATGDAPGIVPSDDGPPPSGVGGGGRDTSGRVVSR